MKWESRAEVFKVVGGVEEQVGQVLHPGVDQLDVVDGVAPQDDPGMSLKPLKYFSSEAIIV